MHGIIEIEQKTHYDINKFIETLKRKAASTNDSPSSLGENGANQRGSSSVKILSNISLPPYRPSVSSQNSSQNHPTTQGKLKRLNSVDKSKNKKIVSIIKIVKLSLFNFSFLFLFRFKVPMTMVMLQIFTHHIKIKDLDWMQAQNRRCRQALVL